MNIVTVSAIVTFAAGGVANVTFFVLLFRLRAAGYPAPLFSILREAKVLAIYKEHSSVHGWSLAPYYTFLVSFIVFAVAGAVLLFQL